MAIYQLSQATAHRCSPAPRSKGLAVAAVLVTAVLFLVVVIANKASIDEATDPGLRRFCWIFGFVSVAACVGILWYAVAALRASIRSNALELAGRTIDSRVSAAVARQDSFFTFGLALAALICLALIHLITMNDGSIQKTLFRFDLIAASLYDIAAAFRVNITLAVVSEIIVLTFGLLLAVARMAPGRAGVTIRMLAIAYIDLFRAIPAIIVIYLIGFGLPLANIPGVSQLPPECFAILAPWDSLMPRRSDTSFSPKRYGASSHHC
jgi:polar amino acid transport system permease protein